MTLRPDRRAAFTLVEVAAVLLIAALLAGVVVASVRGRDQRVRLADVTGALLMYEHQTREHARAFGRPSRLYIDPRHGRLRRVGSDAQPAPVLQLPRGFRIDELRLEDGPAHDEVAIPCSSLGLTPSFAIRLVGPDGRGQWFFFSGLTGAVAKPENGEAIDAAFHQLAAGVGSDAH